jgi:lysozyme
MSPAAAAQSFPQVKSTKSGCASVANQNNCEAIPELVLPTPSAVPPVSQRLSSVPPYRSALVAKPIGALMMGSDTVAGVDLSDWNNVESFWSVQQAGYAFAFVQASQGTDYVDLNFGSYRQRSETVGMVTGFYFILEPGEDATAQLQTYYSVVGNLHPGELACLIDLEPDRGWLQLSQATRIARIEHAASGCAKHYQVVSGVYESLDVQQNYIGSSAGYDGDWLWVADWTTNSSPDVPPGWSKWTFWQWNDQGQINGSEGNTDLDLFHGNIEQLKAFATTASAGK